MRNGKYILVLAPQEYPGKKYRGLYCYEHHLVWWMKTGESLKAGEVIHHKNDDKHDNRFVNLKKMTNREHSKLHGAEKTITMVILECTQCGSSFKKQKRFFKFFFKKGQKNWYCNRKCMGRHQIAKNIHSKKSEVIQMAE